MSVNGPNFPSKPNFNALSDLEKQDMFGKFDFIADPTKDNPEHIKVLDDWKIKNLIEVSIPQLQKIAYAPINCQILFHVKAASQLQCMFATWEKQGLLNNILSYNGAYNPRFIRGSTTYLSNHSMGSAIDLNFEWNMLGKCPALKDQKGCMRDLVGIANEHGFFWGGHFPSNYGALELDSDFGRSDGMHFELAKIL